MKATIITPAGDTITLELSKKFGSFWRKDTLYVLCSDGKYRSQDEAAKRDKRARKRNSRLAISEDQE